MINIEVRCLTMSSADLKEVADRSPELSAFSLSISPAATSYRVDTSVLVAAVGAGSAAVSAFITGLLRVIEGKFNRVPDKIVLEFPSGHKIELPGDMPTEKIKAILEETKESPSRVRVEPF